MFLTLKKILSKLFPQKLATEVTAELPPCNGSCSCHAHDQQLLTEPAPEALTVIEEPVKKKKTPSKKKSKLHK